MAINTSIINKAVKTAKRTNVKRAKICALALTSPSHIITQAYNRRLDGNKEKFTEHAEVALIRKLQKIKAFDRFGHLTILVVRISSYGLALAKPCDKCQILLKQYKNQITIFYSDNNQFKRLKL